MLSPVAMNHTRSMNHLGPREYLFNKYCRLQKNIYSTIVNHIVHFAFTVSPLCVSFTFTLLLLQFATATVTKTFSATNGAQIIYLTHADHTLRHLFFTHVDPGGLSLSPSPSQPHITRLILHSLVSSRLVFFFFSSFSLSLHSLIPHSLRMPHSFFPSISFFLSFFFLSCLFFFPFQRSIAFKHN